MKRSRARRDEQENPDDIIQYNIEHDAKPFKGFVLSCTGLDEDERTAIYKKAQQMGALASPDLTSQVTHLITNTLGTEKYKYAVQFKIPIMSQEWVTRTHERWITGEDLDMNEILAKGKFPALFGLRICCTGLDAELRDWIASNSQENGAQHSPDFTKKCTHLIAYKPEGKKYEHAQRWGTQVVRPEWFVHSVEVGACQDEQKYRLDMEPPSLPTPVDSDSSSRKRSAADDEQETEHFKIRHKRRDSKFDVNDILDSLKQKEALRPGLIPKDSFAKVGPVTPLRRSSSMAGEVILTLAPVEEERNVTLSYSSSLSSKDIFKGKVFAFHGFSKEQGGVLEKELLELGGSVVDVKHGSSGERYVIVPFRSAHGLQQESRYKPVRGEIMVTERWVEACINRERICLPSEHVLYKPLESDLNLLQGAICGTTGFDEIQRRELEVLIKAVGGEYTEGFNKRNTHLICREGSGAKYVRAQKLKIPCLKDRWLFDGVVEGKLPAMEAYIVHPSAGKENKEMARTTSLERDRKPLKSRNSGIVNTFLKQEGNERRHAPRNNRRRPSGPLSPLSRAMTKPPVQVYQLEEQRLEGPKGSRQVYQLEEQRLEGPKISRQVYHWEEQRLEGPKGSRQIYRFEEPRAELPKAVPKYQFDEPSIEGAITYDDPDAQREKADLLSMLKEKREQREGGMPGRGEEILSEGENDIPLEG